MKEKAFLIVEV